MQTDQTTPSGTRRSASQVRQAGAGDQVEDAVVALEPEGVENRFAEMAVEGACLAAGALQPLVAGAVRGGMGQVFGRRQVGTAAFHTRGELQLPAPGNLGADCRLVPLVGGLVEDATLEIGRQVLLGDPVVAVGVRVEVPFPVTESLAVAIGVLEVVGNLVFALLLDRGQGVEEGHGGVALGSRRQVQRRLRQGKAAFGQADPVEGLGRGDDQRQGRPGRRCRRPRWRR